MLVTDSYLSWNGVAYKHTGSASCEVFGLFWLIDGTCGTCCLVNKMPFNTAQSQPWTNGSNGLNRPPTHCSGQLLTSVTNYIYKGKRTGLITANISAKPIYYIGHEYTLSASDDRSLNPISLVQLLT